MRLIDFSTVLYRATQLAGLDRATINSATFSLLRDFANSRIGWVWEHEPWTELIRIEELTPVLNGDNTTTVTLGSGIGSLFQIYNKNPRLGTTARSVQYFIYDNGTNLYANLVGPSIPATVWVEYRIAKPNLFGDAYSATQAYTAGSQIYFDTSSNSGSFTPGAGKAPAGNIYTCIVTTTAGQSPSTNSANWSVVEIPASFSEYLSRAIVSDYWRSEGQFEKAAASEGDATAAIERLLDIQARQQGQISRLNVLSY